MSDRLILGMSECPEWADAASMTGSGLRLAHKGCSGPFKLFVMEAAPATEVIAYFSDDEWPSVEDFWYIYLGIIRLEHPTTDELKVALSRRSLDRRDKLNS